MSEGLIYLHSLFEWEDAILLGTLMGDAYLRKHRGINTNAQLKMGHSKKQEDYLAWKTEQLSRLFKQTKLTNYRTKTGYDTVEVNSRCHPVLTEYRRLFYPDGKKIVNAEILSRIANHSYLNLILAVLVYGRWHHKQSRRRKVLFRWIFRIGIFFACGLVSEIKLSG